MIHFQRDATRAEIMDAYAKQTDSTTAPNPEAHFHQAAASLQSIRRAFLGGSLARSELLRPKIGETQDQWRNRWNNFQNVPLLRIIVGFRTSLLYTKPPDRHLFWKKSGDAEYDEGMVEDSALLDDAFNAIYTQNHVATMFAKQVGPRTNRDMISWVKIWHDKENDCVRITSYKNENVLPILDPADSETALGYVELRPVGSSFDRYLWTTTEYGKITPDWSWDGEVLPNPVKGELPFVCFGSYMADMGNPLYDATFDQQHLVNLRSHVAMGIRSQTYKQMWTAGRIKGPKVKAPEGDGNERIQISPETVIQMDDGGSVNYASPDFPVAAVLEAEAQELRRSLEMYRVSGLSVDPKSAPDQPMSLAIKMMPSLWQRDEDIQTFTDSETMLALKVAKYGAVFGKLPCSVEDVEAGAVEVSIDFDKTIMPSDRSIERMADLQDVNLPRPLMIREDYYVKWQKPGADNNEVEADMAKLDEQAAERAAMQATAINGIVPPRFGGNLAGASPGAGSNGQSNASALLARIGSPGEANISYEGGGSGAGGASATSSGSPGATPGGSSGGRTVPSLG